MTKRIDDPAQPPAMLVTRGRRRGHWVPEMLQVAGAEAVLACAGAPSVRMTWDQITAAAPQVVVFMPCGYGLRAAVDEARQTLLPRPELASVEAIVTVDAKCFLGVVACVGGQ